MYWKKVLIAVAFIGVFFSVEHYSSTVAAADAEAQAVSGVGETVPETETIFEGKATGPIMADGGRGLFRDLSFTLEAGSSVAITGPSGCGKTSLLNVLGLLQPADQGELFWAGQRLDAHSDQQRLRFWREVAAFIYQDYGVIDEASVAYNVTLDRRQTHDFKVKEILKAVGLTGREKRQAVTLSGGEKQRLGLARALYKEAKIIFADEPTASLDRYNRQQVFELLRHCQDQGALVVLATHDENLAKHCDQQICL